MDRHGKEVVAMLHRSAKRYSEPGSNKRGAKADELHLTPLELIDRIAALVPPPRMPRRKLRQPQRPIQMPRRFLWATMSSALHSRATPV